MTLCISQEVIIVVLILLEPCRTSLTIGDGIKVHYIVRDLVVVYHPISQQDCKLRLLIFCIPVNYGFLLTAHGKLAALIHNLLNSVRILLTVLTVPDYSCHKDLVLHLWACLTIHQLYECLKCLFVHVQQLCLLRE